MILEPEDMKKLESLGCFDELYQVTVLSDCGFEIFESYSHFLDNIAGFGRSFGEVIVHELITKALESPVETDLLAICFAFSFNQKEYVERTPKEFVLYVKDELSKRLGTVGSNSH